MHHTRPNHHINGRMCHRQDEEATIRHNTLTHIVFLSLMARCNAFSFTRWYYSWQTSPLIPNKIRNESGEWFYLWPRADRPHETNKNKKNKILQQITFQTAGLPFENQKQQNNPEPPQAALNAAVAAYALPMCARAPLFTLSDIKCM